MANVNVYSPRVEGNKSISNFSSIEYARKIAN